MYACAIGAKRGKGNDGERKRGHDIKRRHRHRHRQREKSAALPVANVPCESHASSHVDLHAANGISLN